MTRWMTPIVRGSGVVLALLLLLGNVTPAAAQMKGQAVPPNKPSHTINPGGTFEFVGAPVFTPHDRVTLVKNTMQYTPTQQGMYFWQPGIVNVQIWMWSRTSSTGSLLKAPRQRPAPTPGRSLRV